jgi:hypothetical protein
MPVSLELMRILVGGLSVFFAHFLGRTVVQVSQGKKRRRPLYTWALRFVLSLVAVSYWGVDRVALIVIVLDLAAFAAGWWDEWRPKHEEDLTRTMFPEDR